MYFAILWKHTTISLTELQTCLQLHNLHIEDQIVCFDTDEQWYHRLQTLGGIIKYGKVITVDSLSEEISGMCIGTQDEDFALHLKKTYHCKRYKIVWLNHTDQEIKDRGKEIIALSHDTQCVWIVTWYQDIDLYTQIDIAKPSSGMQIGMMPAKLAHILINLALWNHTHDAISTIYDPFCGFGTTLMLANALGHHSIGSDINITQTKLNLKRWKTQSHYHDHNHLTIFKHDIYDTFTHPLLHQVNAIVTEGWLGPIVSHQTTRSQYHDYSIQIWELYKTFLTHIQPYHIPQIVMTVPHYTHIAENELIQTLTDHIHTLWYQVTWIDQLYHRPGQLVARQIGILSIQ